MVAANHAGTQRTGHGDYSMLWEEAREAELRQLRGEDYFQVRRRPATARPCCAELHEQSPKPAAAE